MSARSKVTKAVLSRIFKKELLKHCGGFTAPGLFEQSRTQPAMLSHLSSCLVWQAGIATRHESTSARTSSGATSELVSQAAPRTYLVHSGNYILSREPGISGHTVPSLHEAARELQVDDVKPPVKQQTTTGRQLIMDHEAATSTATNKSPVEQQTTTGRQLIMDHEAATSTATNKSPVEQQTTTGRQLIMDHETATSTAASASAAEDGDEDAEHEAATDSKERLLAGALKHVKAQGWSAGALELAARENGLSPAAVGMLTKPEAELVQYFVGKCNKELADKLEASKAELQGLRVPERIRTALQWRLEMLIPYMESWPQALAILATPGSLPTTVRQVSELVDDIWYAAGDKSTDYNWYTKRALLAAVYSATELYMLTDYSPGYADTWEALDRRLQDVARLGKATGQARGMMTQVAENLGVAAQFAQEQFLQHLRNRR